MAPKQAPKKRVPKPEAVAAATDEVTLKVYRRIAVSFVLIVALLLAAVLYISTVQATIVIDPVETAERTEFIVDAVRTPTRPSEIRGRVVSGTLGRSRSFEPSGTGQREVVGTARGTVTIHNEGSSEQVLVRTTRLLTPDEVLFRIDERVRVPAGGSVEVPAYADEEGGSGDIKEGVRMRIPGLSASLQEIIYAESETAFFGGHSVVSAVSDQDIASATNELERDLVEDAKQMLRQEAGEVFAGEAFSSEIASQSRSIEPGEQAESFEVSLTLQVVGVFYDEGALMEIATRKLYDELASGREFFSINAEQAQVTVEKADVEGEMANLRVYLDGRTVPSPTSAALDPGRFAGMDEEEVRQLLISEGLAEHVEVEFFPFWIKSVPRLRDHIYIQIEE